MPLNRTTDSLVTNMWGLIRRKMNYVKLKTKEGKLL